MGGSSEKVQKAFDEGRFLDVVRAAKTRKNPEDKLLAGISLYRLSRYAEARQVLEKVAEQAKSLAASEYFLALIHDKEGDGEAFKACLERYLAYYPDDDEARDLLEQASCTDHEELVTEPSVELAKIYAQQGHYEQALNIYAEVERGAGLGEEARRHAGAVQNLYIMKTLEEWLVRLRK
jgi:tetratricopeptide (TPR) repeat protein